MSVTLLRDFPRPSEIHDIRSATAWYVNTVGPSARSLTCFSLLQLFSVTYPIGVRNRDSVIGILIRLRAGRSGVRIPALRPTQTPSQWVIENTVSAHSKIFTWRCRAACMIEGSSERPVEGKGGCREAVGQLVTHETNTWHRSCSKGHVR